MKLFLLLLALIAVSDAFRFNRINHKWTGLHAAVDADDKVKELDISEVDGVSLFKQIAEVKKNTGKYRIEGVITKEVSNEYLEEYKQEMIRRKVSFPGFRVGKLPPYVMTDVRKYLISFGLENVLTTLMNNNMLRAVDENCQELPNSALADDNYFQQIIQEDDDGRDYLTVRDSWREGADFSYAIELFAEDIGNAMEEGFDKGESDDGIPDAEGLAGADDKVIEGIYEEVIKEAYDKIEKEEDA
jgi:hypothetical protein